MVVNRNLNSSLQNYVGLADIGESSDENISCKEQVDILKRRLIDANNDIQLQVGAAEALAAIRVRLTQHIRARPRIIAHLGRTPRALILLLARWRRQSTKLCEKTVSTRSSSGSSP